MHQSWSEWGCDYVTGMSWESVEVFFPSKLCTDEQGAQTEAGCERQRGAALWEVIADQEENASLRTSLSRLPKVQAKLAETLLLHCSWNPNACFLLIFANLWVIGTQNMSYKTSLVSIALSFQSNLICERKHHKKFYENRKKYLPFVE